LLVNLNPNHLDTEDDVSRFESLSRVAVMSLLTGDFDLAIEDIKFGIFFIWIKKNEVDYATKRNMLDAFDLEKFSSLFLLETVRKTGYFKDEDLFNTLIGKVKTYENLIAEKDKRITFLENDKRITFLESRLDPDLESDYSDY